MAENLLNKINLDGTEMIISDTKARTDASKALSTANTASSTATTANTNATKAISIANSAKDTAAKKKKALINYDSVTYTMTIIQGGE